MRNFDLTLYKLIDRKIEIKNFEQWVYSEKELERILTPDDYLDLISSDYSLPSSLYEAEKILKPYIDIGKHLELNLHRVLQKVIDRPKDAHKFIEQCYDMYCDGYNFLDNLGLGYGLHVSVPPSNYGADTWQELKSHEQLKLINSFYPAVAQEAQKVLLWLDTEKIILTGHDGGYQGIEYEDNRTPQEKKPTRYKVAAPSKKKWWKFWYRHR